MAYTVYELETGKISYRTSRIGYDGVPDGCDWIIGDHDDVRFRINPETGEPYPFIEQSQLPWLIRRKAKVLLQDIGMTDADVTRWTAAKATFDMVGSATINGTAYNEDRFRELLMRRNAILENLSRLSALDPIPQDVEDDKHWR